MDPYILQIAEQVTRKILSSDDTVAGKADYLARVLESAVRNQVVTEVELAFSRLDANLEAQLLDTNSAQEVFEITETQQSIRQIREHVLGKIR